MDVVLVRWPVEQERRAALAADSQARLLLVEGMTEAPIPDDLLEDWIRVPADESDVQAAVEDAVANVFKKVLGVELKRPFPKMTYAEAMDKYGSDKPDIRFGMHLVDVSDLAKASAFRVFSEAIATGGVVKGLCVSGGGGMSRKEIDDLTTYVKGNGAKGLVWLKGENGTLGGTVGTRAPLASRMMRLSAWSKPCGLSACQ